MHAENMTDSYIRYQRGGLAINTTSVVIHAAIITNGQVYSSHKM